jgi:hypothetical protein
MRKNDGELEILAAGNGWRPKAIPIHDRAKACMVAE